MIYCIVWRAASPIVPHIAHHHFFTIYLSSLPVCGPREWEGGRKLHLLTTSSTEAFLTAVKFLSAVERPKFLSNPQHWLCPPTALSVAPITGVKQGYGQDNVETTRKTAWNYLPIHQAPHTRSLHDIPRISRLSHPKLLIPMNSSRRTGPHKIGAVLLPLQPHPLDG